MFFQGTRNKISAILVCLLFISILVPTAAMGAETGTGFKDTANSYAQQEIQGLVDSQVISGYEDGSFQPEKAMTRAELAKILVLSLGLQEQVDQASVFTDVAGSSWYSGYIGTLVKSGITQGTSATTFSPNANVTREELVLFFIRAMGLEKSALSVHAPTELSDFEEVSSWAQPAVSLAFQIGFINGIEGNDGSLTFSPKVVAQRQALARLAFEFKTNKTVYMHKAQELAHIDETEITSIESVSSTSMEVTFAKEATNVHAADFTFDPDLPVTQASIAAGSPAVVVLTTKDQLSGTTYRLSYKGKDTGKTVKGSSSFFGGGGGGGGGAAPAAKSDLDKINGGGTYDSLTVTSPGTIGPADDKTKTIVTGTLTLNPGANGEILLQNVEASNIIVTSGSSNSIKLKNTIIKTLRVAAPNQTTPVRIETLSGSDVSDLDVQSKVIIESTAGSLGMIKIGSAASGQVVELRGTLKGDIQVDGEGTQIKIAPPQGGGTTSVTTLNVGAKATIIAAEGTTLQHVNVTAKSEISLTGTGNITSLTVSEAAQGSTLNLSNAGGRISAIQLDGNVNLQGDADTIGAIKLTAKPGVVVEVAPSLTDTLKNKAVSAIAAIGVFSVYSAEVDEKIKAAEIVADNAILLGVSPEEITGYTTTLVQAKQKIDKLAVEAAVHDLQIQYAGKDSHIAVTQNIGMPVLDTNRGVSISWKSSSPAVVSNDGTVTRPAIGSANETIVLTANLSRNMATEKTEFVITVVAQLAPVLETLTVDPNQFVFHNYKEIGQLNVTANYSNGSSKIVTKEAKYFSSDVNVARVSDVGEIIPVDNGTATISFVYGGLQRNATVTVDISDGGMSEKTATPTYGGIVYPNSIKLIGTSEPSANQLWNTVTLSKRDGSIITDSIVTPDGSFNLSTNFDIMSRVSLSVGEELLLTARAYGKNGSDSVVVVVQSTQGQAPKPTVTNVVYEANSLIIGYAEPGADVTVSYGEVRFATSRAIEDGSYSLYLWQNDHHAGEQVRVVATVHGKATSEAAVVLVQESLKTAKPTVTGVVYTNGYKLSGVADPGEYHNWSRVVLHKQDGTFITQNNMNEDGTYLMRVNRYNPIPLEAGEQVHLTAQAYGQKESDPVVLIVQAITGQTLKPSISGVVYDSSYGIHGYAEPDALISIYSSDYDNTSFTAANSDGSFEYHPANFKAGASFSITATVPGKATSEPIYVTVQTGPKTATPTVAGDVFTNGFIIKGNVDIDSEFVYASIILAKKDGTNVASVGVNQDGTFSVRSDLYPNSSHVTLVAGEELLITAQAYGKNASDPVVLTVKPTQGRTAAVMTDVVNETVISGWAEYGATVIIRSESSGRELRASSYNEDKFFIVYSDATNAFQIGDHLSITATVIGQETSEPIKVTVGAAKQTETPTVTGNVYTNFIRISGSTVPGTKNIYTTVYLKKQDGTYVTTWGVGQEGYFWVDNLLENPYISLTAGEELLLAAKAYGMKESAPVPLIVQATNGQTASPTITELATEAAFSGWAEPGAIVRFQVVPNGLSSWIPVSYDGSFSFSMFPDGYLHAGDQVKITAITIGKATSDPIYVTLAAAPKTAAPTVTGVVYTNGFMLQGSVSSESSFTSISLMDKNGSNFGNYGVGPDSHFSTSQLLQSYPILKAGDIVQLKAREYGKISSDPVSFVVQATKGQTEVPTINDDIIETKSFNGHAEPGAILTLRNDTTGYTQTTVAAADGSYSFYWEYKAYRIGDQLSLNATVLGKETSDTVQITLIASP